MSKYVCYSSDGATLSNLYQWDLNQSIIIGGYTGDITPVFHFCNRCSRNAIPVVPTKHSKGLLAEVPNELLWDPESIIVFFYTESDDAGVTSELAVTIPVCPRPKPADYVYESNVAYINLVEISEKVQTIYNQLAGLDGESIGSGILTISDIVDNCESQESEAPLSANQGYLLQTQIAVIQEQLADLLYEEISIASFTNNVGTVELGATVGSVTLTWETNKTPTALTLDGKEVDANLSSYTYSNLALGGTKTYKLIAVDERGKTATKTTTVYFYNGVYYGVVESGTQITSDVILGLTRKLQGAKAMTFTANAGSAQRIIYALPSSGYGTPNFNVGGFDGGFFKAGTILFKNASGYEEYYDIWLSDNLGLGSTTVKVT